jgi:cytochrome P450/NADPH-cytochrome P450 reductase
LGGKYAAPTGRVFTVVTPRLHRDPAVWGDDADTLDPDRFAFERAQTLPPNSWRPFGNGQRSCIGRGFALQEATLFLAILLQRFDLAAADPGYELKIRQGLTIKPDGFFMTARRRDTVT